MSLFHLLLSIDHIFGTLQRTTTYVDLHIKLQRRATVCVPPKNYLKFEIQTFFWMSNVIDHCRVDLIQQVQEYLNMLLYIAWHSKCWIYILSIKIMWISTLLKNVVQLLTQLSKTATKAVDTFRMFDEMRRNKFPTIITFKTTHIGLKLIISDCKCINFGYPE